MPFGSDGVYDEKRGSARSIHARSRMYRRSAAHDTLRSEA